MNTSLETGNVRNALVEMTYDTHNFDTYQNSEGTEAYQSVGLRDKRLYPESVLRCPEAYCGEQNK
jgi:hypothetical protein